MTGFFITKIVTTGFRMMSPRAVSKPFSTGSPQIQLLDNSDIQTEITHTHVVGWCLRSEWVVEDVVLVVIPYKKQAVQRGNPSD